MDNWLGTMTTTGNEAAHGQYLPLLWPVRQSGASVKRNDVILMNLMMSHCFNPWDLFADSYFIQSNEFYHRYTFILYPSNLCKGFKDPYFPTLMGNTNVSPQKIV